MRDSAAMQRDICFYAIFAIAYYVATRDAATAGMLLRCFAPRRRYGVMPPIRCRWLRRRRAAATPLR